jgi:hypothetical protein
MDAPNYEQPTNGTPGDQYREGLIKAFVEKIKNELGDDPDLIKQCVADLNAQHRQDARNHFESRQEYVRQVFELKSISLAGIREYGLQTLKWLFLLNASAIAVILAYVSGLVGKPSSTVPVTTFLPILKALWPFVVGCALVVFGGAAGFFNFSYGEATLPSAEGLHNFFDPISKAWPQPRFNQFGWKVSATRNAAIVCAFGSIFFFGYGFFRVLHAALKQLT